MSPVQVSLPPSEEFHNRHARTSHAHISPPLHTAGICGFPLPSSISRTGPSERVMKALELDVAQKRRKSIEEEEEKAALSALVSTSEEATQLFEESRRPSLPAMYTRLSSEPTTPTSELIRTGSEAVTAATATSEPSAIGKEPLIQLVYTSSSRDRYLPRSELEKILKASRVTNARGDITGLLLYRDGSFAQFLEGPRSAVLDTFERIRSDPRHRGVIVVLQRSIEKRDFSEWRMGFRDVDAELKKGSNNDEDTGEVGSTCVGQEGKEAVLDLSVARITDLTFAETSRSIRTLINVFHKSIIRAV